MRPGAYVILTQNGDLPSVFSAPVATPEIMMVEWHQFMPGAPLFAIFYGPFSMKMLVEPEVMNG